MELYISRNHKFFSIFSKNSKGNYCGNNFSNFFHRIPEMLTTRSINLDRGSQKRVMLRPKDHI